MPARPVNLVGRRPFCLAAALLLVACSPGTRDPDDDRSGGGGGDGGSPDAGPVDGGYIPPPRLDFACPSGMSLQAGLNTVAIGTRTRVFHLDIPNVAAGTKLAVVFSWHGVGDSISNWRQYVSVNPAGDPNFPFIIVTPESLQLRPPQGLDWDMFETGTDNAEQQLVEAVLGCLQDDYVLDLEHIHSAGFSGGAIVTNMLHSAYPQVFASTAALSGAWFNDEAEKALVDPTGQVRTLGMLPTMQWTALDADDTSAVMLSRGGPSDQYGVSAYGFNIPVINFNDAVTAAVPFLKARGRTSIVCAHTNGHQPPPGLSAQKIIDFFKAHPRGVQGTAVPAGWPAGCTFQAADN